MNTERYCLELESVSRVDMIRAIHEAHLQLSALNSNVDCGHYDNQPALASLAQCLSAAGHPGFVNKES